MALNKTEWCFNYCVAVGVEQSRPIGGIVWMWKVVSGRVKALLFFLSLFHSTRMYYRGLASWEADSEAECMEQIVYGVA